MSAYRTWDPRDFGQIDDLLMAEKLDPVRGACQGRVRSWPAPWNWSAAEWFEEMEAVAVLAAWEAAREYDLSGGVAFEAFVYNRAIGALRTRYRNEWAFGDRFVPICGPGWNGKEIEGEAGGIVEWGEPSCESNAERLEAVDALEFLSEEDRLVVRKLYWEGRSEAALVESLGIKRRAVSKRKRRVLKLLREYLAPAVPVEIRQAA